MDNIMTYKGYWAEIKYSDEDECFCGKIEGLKDSLILFEGQTVKELKKDFEDAIDSYLDNCRKNNEVPESQINNTQFPDSQIFNNGIPKSQIKNSEIPEAL
jgi:predicted HicB family RNase H-like nuclease